MNKAFLAVLLALATIVTITSYAHAAAEDLHDAARAGDIAAVRRLLERGANVNARDEYRRTPLHHAAFSGNTEVAALLIQKGANVNARDEYQETPLHHAAYWGKTEVAALLIQKGAKVNARDENQETPLHWAARGPDRCGRIAHSERRKRKCQGRLPGDAAASCRFSGHDRIAALLIQKGANVNARNEDQWTPLHQAAFAGNTRLLIVSKGVNARGVNQKTPLHWAAFAGNTGCGIADSERRRRKCQGREPKDAVALGHFCGQHRGCSIAHSERRRRKCLKWKTLNRLV